MSAVEQRERRRWGGPRAGALVRSATASWVNTASRSVVEACDCELGEGRLAGALWWRVTASWVKDGKLERCGGAAFLVPPWRLPRSSLPVLACSRPP